MNEKNPPISNINGGWKETVPSGRRHQRALENGNASLKICFWLIFHDFQILFRISFFPV